MIPSPRELEYFLEIGNTGSVSRAAERLGVSQPTLSLAIQRLENGLGTPLLIRTKTGVELTRAGQKLVSQARHLLDEWERIRKETLAGEEEIRGTYSLGCHPSVGLFTLPHFLDSLLEENRGLELKLIHDLSRKITEDVISFKCDFGIVVNPWEHPDLVIRPLWKDEVSLWTSEKPGKLQDPSTGEAVLLCDPELIQSQTILKGLKEADIRFQRVVTSSSLEVIASLVSSHVGIGILPARVANRVASYKLKPLEGKSKKVLKFIDQHSLVFRRDAQNSKANRLLAKAIEAKLLTVQK